jgi:signal transduction protein with GAF and PtsI domain
MRNSKMHFEQIPVADIRNMVEIDKSPARRPKRSARRNSMSPVETGRGDSIRFFDSGLKLIHGKGDLRKALAPLVQLAAEGARSQAASFYVVDSRENVLKPLVTYGLPAAYVEACGKVRIGDQCCGRAVQHLKPWVVSDMLNDPLFASARTAALASPIRAAFSVPVIDDKHACIGSLACHFTGPHRPSREDIERNQTWATLIAHIISEYKRGLSQPRNIGLVS